VFTGAMRGRGTGREGKSFRCRWRMGVCSRVEERARVITKGDRWGFWLLDDCRKRIRLLAFNERLGLEGELYSLQEPQKILGQRLERLTYATIYAETST